MLTGPALGQAIESAMTLKGVTRSAMARHFEVKPESTYDWTKHGRIGKEKLTALFEYFSDVAGPEHWGIQPGSFWLSAQSQPARLDHDILTRAIEVADASDGGLTAKNIIAAYELLLGQRGPSTVVEMPPPKPEGPTGGHVTRRDSGAGEDSGRARGARKK